jgi:hypothetical protein
MVGDDPVTLTADIQLLRDKNFLVYTSFDTDNLHSLIEEIHPDLLFINPQKENAVLADVYNNVTSEALLALPVVYTLLEDNVYIVTRKNAATGNKNAITDNILSAVKLALDYSDHIITAQHHIPAAQKGRVAFAHSR